MSAEKLKLWLDC